MACALPGGKPFMGPRSIPMTTIGSPWLSPWQDSSPKVTRISRTAVASIFPSLVSLIRCPRLRIDDPVTDRPARRSGDGAMVRRRVPGSFLVSRSGTRRSGRRLRVGSHSKQAYGPVFRLEANGRPAFAQASADTRVVAFLHDPQARRGKVAIHFPMRGRCLDFETARGRQAQFDLTLLQFDIDGMRRRSRGAKLHVAVGVRDFDAVLEVREGDVFLASRDFEGAVDAVQLERTDLHVEPAGEFLRGHIGARGLEVQGLLDVAEVHVAIELAVDTCRAGDPGNIDVAPTPLNFQAALQIAHFRQPAAPGQTHQPFDIADVRVSVTGSDGLLRL